VAIGGFSVIKNQEISRQAATPQKKRRGKKKASSNRPGRVEIYSMISCAFYLPSIYTCGQFIGA
jgi:hypothetical protein